MFRIGELTQSQHVVKTKDVHIGLNKDKLMFVLHSSKTHGKGNKPQIIKIDSVGKLAKGNQSPSNTLCPFTLLKNYVSIRGKYQNNEEQFFVFRD